MKRPDDALTLQDMLAAARRAPVTCVLSNSAGIGGRNAAAIFRKAAAG